MSERIMCSICGDDVTLLENFGLEKPYCLDCVKKALQWGMERYSDAVIGPRV
jgi:hypothetical protein